MALWTPADLAVAPRVWIDGDDATFNGSNQLTALTSKGADGAAMTIGSTAPTKATLNSLNGLHCVGNNQHVRQTVAAWGSGGKLFVISVTKKRVSQASNYAFIMGHGAFPDGSPSNQLGYLHDDDSTGGPSFYVSGYPSTVHIEKLDTALFGTAAHVFSTQVGSTNAMRLDGAAVTPSASATGSVTNYTSRTWWFGAGGSADSSYMDGDLFQLVLLDYFPSTDELAKLEGWAAWKYGLQGSLPTGHAYKSAAPTTGGASYGLAGVAAGSGTAAGALAARRPLAGVSAGAGADSATLGALRPLAGASTGVGAAAGDLTKAYPLAGSAAGTTTAALAIGAERPFSGSAAGVGSTAGVLAALRPLAGSADGQGAATSPLGATRPMAAMAAGAGAAAGGLGILHPLTGGALGAGQASAAVGADRRLAGAVAGAALASLDLGATHPLAGSAVGIGAASGGLSLVSQQALAGSTSGASEATASIRAGRPISGSAAGAAEAAASAGARRPLKGVPSGQGAAAGALGALRPLIGSAAGQGAGAAVLGRLAPLSGASGGLGSAIVDLQLASTIVIAPPERVIMTPAEVRVIETPAEVRVVATPAEIRII